VPRSFSNPFMPRFLLLALLASIALLHPTPLHAHQVPSLTLEAKFTAEGAAAFSINLDPRLFLAEDPTTLPPVPAPWFRDQSEQERAETLASARAYVQSAITFFFDDQKAAALTWEFIPIDGATGEPFTEATSEVHFLAQCKTTCPAAAGTSSIRLEPAAKAAAVLLNSFKKLGDQEAQSERRPQILFPGESSRAFKIQPASP
jgi:hypothetical protein